MTMNDKMGAYWKWPDKKDEIWYRKNDVIKRIDPPVVVGSWGQFSFISDS